MANQVFARVDEWEGRAVVDRVGDKIGKIEDIYFDVDTNEPEWARVRTGLFGMRDTIIPVTGASLAGDDVQVPFDKDHVKDAPNVHAEDDLSQADEATLAKHYGLRYSEARSDTGLPQGGAEQPSAGGKDLGRDASGPTTDSAMTRSEEELRVDKARRPSELVRLKKHVVTEQQQVTVPVQHEELRVEREPITDENRGQAMSGPDLSDEEHEMTLTEEQVVVDKKVVPKERVRLDKDVRTEDQTVGEDVRKEQIDVERQRS
jgi:uncharacterized protein (TIGR02271 family)